MPNDFSPRPPVLCALIIFATAGILGGCSSEMSDSKSNSTADVGETWSPDIEGSPPQRVHEPSYDNDEVRRLQKKYNLSRRCRNSLSRWQRKISFGAFAVTKNGQTCSWSAGNWTAQAARTQALSTCEARDNGNCHVIAEHAGQYGDWSLSEFCEPKLDKWRDQKAHGAFAVSRNGLCAFSYNYQTFEGARDAAITACESIEVPCRIEYTSYDINKRLADLANEDLKNGSVSDNVCEGEFLSGWQRDAFVDTVTQECSWYNYQLGRCLEDFTRYTALKSRGRCISGSDDLEGVEFRCAVVEGKGAEDGYVVCEVSGSQRSFSVGFLDKGLWDESWASTRMRIVSRACGCGATADALVERHKERRSPGGKIVSEPFANLSLDGNDRSYNAQFSPDGETVVSGHNSKIAKWNGRTGELEDTIAVGDWGGISTFTFAPDGSTLAVAVNGGSYAARMQLNTGRILGTFLKESDDSSWMETGPKPTSIRFFADGNHLLTTLSDQTAIVWDANRLSPQRTFGDIVPHVVAADISADQKLVLIVNSVQARVWDFEQARVLAYFDRHSHRSGLFGGFYDGVFSPDSSHVVTVGADDVARLWEARTGREVARFEGHADPVLSTDISPSGNLLITGSADHTARIWDMGSKQNVVSFVGHGSGVDSVAISPDEKLLLTVTIDGNARLWRVPEDL